jgi:hypothetical protein
MQEQQSQVTILLDKGGVISVKDGVSSSDILFHFTNLWC